MLLDVLSALFVTGAATAGFGLVVLVCRNANKKPEKWWNKVHW